MGDLEVDVDGLEALVASLGGVRDGLDDTRRLVHESSDTMGSADVAGALDDFENHWADVRGRVAENIEAIIGAVEESARAYRQADDDLRESMLDAVREQPVQRLTRAPEIR
jgi:ABC-type transporter Mla subunit MlaD